MRSQHHHHYRQPKRKIDDLSFFNGCAFFILRQLHVVSSLFSGCISNLLVRYDMNAIVFLFEWSSESERVSDTSNTYHRLPKALWAHQNNLSDLNISCVQVNYYLFITGTFMQKPEKSNRTIHQSIKLDFEIKFRLWLYESVLNLMKVKIEIFRFDVFFSENSEI